MKTLPAMNASADCRRSRAFLMTSLALDSEDSRTSRQRGRLLLFPVSQLREPSLMQPSCPLRPHMHDTGYKLISSDNFLTVAAAKQSLLTTSANLRSRNRSATSFPVDVQALSWSVTSFRVSALRK
jgi:hypothetical protein